MPLFGAKDFTQKYFVGFASLIGLAITAAFIKVLYMRRKLRKAARLADIEVQRSSINVNIPLDSTRPNGGALLFGVRALEAGYFGGVVQANTIPRQSSTVRRNRTHELRYNTPEARDWRSKRRNFLRPKQHLANGRLGAESVESIDLGDLSNLRRIAGSRREAFEPKSSPDKIMSPSARNRSYFCASSMKDARIPAALRSNAASVGHAKPVSPRPVLFKRTRSSLPHLFSSFSYTGDWRRRRTIPMPSAVQKIYPRPRKHWVSLESTNAPAASSLALKMDGTSANDEESSGLIVARRPSSDVFGPSHGSHIGHGKSLSLPASSCSTLDELYDRYHSGFTGYSVASPRGPGLHDCDWSDSRSRSRLVSNRAVLTTAPTSLSGTAFLNEFGGRIFRI